jgi:hypothetical protein
MGPVFSIRVVECEVQAAHCGKKMQTVSHAYPYRSWLPLAARARLARRPDAHLSDVVRGQCPRTVAGSLTRE